MRSHIVKTLVFLVGAQTQLVCWQGPHGASSMLNHCGLQWISIQPNSRLHVACSTVRSVFCNLGDLQWSPSEKLGTLCMFAQEQITTWCTGQEVAMKLVQNISSIIKQLKILNILLKLTHGRDQLKTPCLFAQEQGGKRMLWNKSSTAEWSTNYPSIWNMGTNFN